MPYIDQQLRKYLADVGLEKFLAHSNMESLLKKPGVITYLFTRIILRFCDLHGRSFETYSRALGILESCKLELYRRRVVPYEKQKAKENGDVY